jgi:hypothetical protein
MGLGYRAGDCGIPGTGAPKRARCSLDHSVSKLLTMPLEGALPASTNPSKLMFVKPAWEHE